MTQETIDQYVRSALALAGYALREPATAEIVQQFSAHPRHRRASWTSPVHGAGVRLGVPPVSGPAQDIAHQVRSGQRSAMAVLDATLARVRERDPRYNCFTALTEGRARQEAAAIDARARAALPRSRGVLVCREEPVRHRRRK